MRLSATLRPVTRLTGSLGVATITTFGDATALVSDILAPKTAYIATGKITGTCTFDADTSDADAVESDILLGKTAYVDGEKKTGTSTLNADTTDATLTANDMLYGVTGYGADGTKLTGAGAWWQYVRTIPRTFMNSAIAGNVELFMPMLDADNSLYLAFSGCAAITNLTLTFVSSGSTYGGVSCFAGMSSCTSITINGSFASATGFVNIIDGCVVLVSVLGTPLDCSNNTLFTNSFRNCYELQTISFMQSTMKVSFNFLQSPLLSTASLLSIANGLNAAAPRTLTMHATSKTNMDNINVDNMDGVAVLGTAKTLSQFITTDKGWSIA